MLNRGEEKVRVHMNVVPRSTRNTNSGTENYRPRLSLCDLVAQSAHRLNLTKLEKLWPDFVKDIFVN